MSTDNILETDRLVLSKLSADHASFILELVNDPAWLKFIGDRGIRTLEHARDYILNGPIRSYERLGYGLYLTRLKNNGVPIGICGLVKRDFLENVDIGFAFLPAYRKYGYAFESASAVMNYAKTVLGIARIVAFTSPGNQSSILLLIKLGLRFEKTIRLTSGGEECELFVPIDQTPASAADR